MEGISTGLPIVAEIAASLNRDRFTLIDVGCGGEIDVAWREFGECLQAFGFDPNLEEVESPYKSGEFAGHRIHRRVSVCLTAIRGRSQTSRQDVYHAKSMGAF